MPLKSLLIDLILSAVLIVGAYQFYFWCQRHVFFEPREFPSGFDRLIPYQPSWVWIYSLLYYPAILYVNAALKSSQQFTEVAASYLLLLCAQAGFFLIFPVRTPECWRRLNARRTPAERFLAFVQRFDARSNSFPSMHTSVATLTSLHLYPQLGVYGLLFPLLIGLSCLFTKQHYLVDIPAGVALGWLVDQVYLNVIAP